MTFDILTLLIIELIYPSKYENKSKKKTNIVTFSPKQKPIVTKINPLKEETS